MFELTAYERKIIFLVVFLIIAGSVIRFYNLHQKAADICSDGISGGMNGISLPDIVNINSASQNELEKIPGIGVQIAGEIIEHRSKIGGFQTFEDLEKIKGIGRKKIEIIKRYITF